MLKFTFIGHQKISRSQTNTDKEECIFLGVPGIEMAAMFVGTLCPPFRRDSESVSNYEILSDINRKHKVA